MLYSTEKLTSSTRTFSPGNGKASFTISQVCLGKPGPDQRIIALTCPDKVRIVKGKNPALSVGYTNSWRPRLINEDGRDELYLLLSSSGGSDGPGYIFVPKRTNTEYLVMARGRGTAESQTWVNALIHAPHDGGVIRIHRGGKDEDDELILFRDAENIMRCSLKSLKQCCKRMKMDVPCHIIEKDGELSFGMDWTMI